MNRKIDIYVKAPEGSSDKWVYVWSTWTFKTCKGALASARIHHPNKQFKACFA